MAFMIPVVRNDWDVWMGTGNPRLGKNPRIGQSGDNRSDEISLATTPIPIGGVSTENVTRKRSLAIEIRNQQHLRISGGSLPSSFQSTQSIAVPLSGASPRYRRPRSSTPRFHSIHTTCRNGKHVSEPDSSLSPVKVSDAATTESLRVSTETISPPTKVGSHNALQKFHVRLIDRLRRSLRLHSGLSTDGGNESCDGDNGSRASS